MPVLTYQIIRSRINYYPSLYTRGGIALTDEERLAEIWPLIQPSWGKVTEVMVIAEFYSNMLGISQQEVLSWPWVQEEINAIVIESFSSCCGNNLHMVALIAWAVTTKS